MKNFLWCSLSVWLASGAAWAQDSATVTTLREVVVSGSRTPRPLMETPRSVTVISRETIERTVYSSLGDLLNRESGLFVAGANQTPGAIQNVFLRGANSNQVAVLIDGVRITDPSSPNAALDLSEISLLRIERIEILRGAHSTMYGGAAVGGVINIITRDAAREGLQGEASWQGGVFGPGAVGSSATASARYGLKQGVYVDAALFRQDVSGLDASDKSALPSFTADRDDFSKTDVFGAAGIRKNGIEGQVSFKHVAQRADLDQGAYADDDNYYTGFTRNLLNYRFAYDLGPGSKISAAGSTTDSRRYYENDSSRVSDLTYDHIFSRSTYHGKLQTHEIQISGGHQGLRGVAGVGTYREAMFFDTYFFYNDPNYPFELTTNYDTLDTRTSTVYLFGQGSVTAGNFTGTAGARVSHHSTAGAYYTFEISPSYRWNSWLVFSSLSSGFNAPSLYQLFDPTKAFGAHTTRGNPDLVPERSLSLEAGMKKEFEDGSYFTFSAFASRLKDAIEYVYLWDGGKSIEALGFSDARGDTYVNVAGQHVHGLEASGYAALTKKLSVQANATLLKGEVRIRPGDVSASHTGGHHVQLFNLGEFLTDDIRVAGLVRRPDFSCFVRSRYALGSTVGLSASYRYTGGRFDAGYDAALGPYGGLARIAVEGFHLVDTGVDWQATRSVTVALQAENIFDEDYRELAGFSTRGRAFYLKLSARW